jgi:hypothetical protein
MKAKALIRPEYVAFVAELKTRIVAARLHAANLERPVQELRAKARSSAGLAEGAEFLQQLVEEIPWGHHLLLLDKVKDPAALPERSGK